MNDLAAAIIAMANQRGIDPLDVATTISYETGGTFDPWKAGPTTQYGQHRGLIQWGEPQRQRYGVSEGMPIGAQVDAIGRYFDDTGVKPGMGLMDIYSAVNAGGVGRYGASDANNGGAPGTVADKVNTQMAGHRANAERLLGDLVAPQGAQPAAPMAATGAPGQLPGAGIAASMLFQSYADRQREEQDAEAEDKARRAALFGGGTLPGLYG